jgi:hypothetical protein
MKNIRFFLSAIASMLMFSSCATLITGTTSKVTIDGDVNEPVTITTSFQTYEDVELPQVVKISRKAIDGQRIQIESEHYKFKDVVLRKSINGWAWGNILIGGLIGLGIDLGTNAVSKPAIDSFNIKPIPKENKEAPNKEKEDIQ